MRVRPFFGALLPLAAAALTVTVFGIDPCTESDVEQDPKGILARTPEVVTRFVVLPK